MHVSVTGDPLDRVAVVTLCGELGIDSAGQLRAVLADLIGRASIRIVIDLSALACDDFVGLSALVDAHRRCTRAGGYLRLAAPSPSLRFVLSVVDMLDAIPVFDSVTAAASIDETSFAARGHCARPTTRAHESGAVAWG